MRQKKTSTFCIHYHIQLQYNNLSGAISKLFFTSCLLWQRLCINSLFRLQASSQFNPMFASNVHRFLHGSSTWKERAIQECNENKSTAVRQINYFTIDPVSLPVWVGSFITFKVARPHNMRQEEKKKAKRHLLPLAQILLSYTTHLIF